MSASTLSEIGDGVTPLSAMHVSVNVVFSVIGDDVRPPLPDVIPVHESPLVPITLQLATLSTFQYTLVTLPCRTIPGRTSRWPEKSPVGVYSGSGFTHADCPAEQNDGAVQVATVEVTHELFVYCTLFAEHE